MSFKINWILDILIRRDVKNLNQNKCSILRVKHGRNGSVSGDENVNKLCLCGLLLFIGCPDYCLHKASVLQTEFSIYVFLPIPLEI